MDEDDTREAWRISNETSVPFPEALTSWADAAHTVLAETAARFGAFINAAELAAMAQQVAGVKTREPVRNWLPEVLDAVSDACHEAGDPPLVALCVNRNQTVHAGYLYAVQVAGLPPADDLDAHSALARFQCYEYFGATIPAGAVPQLPPLVAEARAVAERKAAATKPARAPRTPKVKSARAAAPSAPRTAATKSRAAKPTKPVVEEKPLRLCPNCYTVLPGNSSVCEYCL
jgi:hypothetical protein